MNKKLKWTFFLVLLFIIGVSIPTFATSTLPTVNLSLNPSGTNQQTAGTVQIVILLTILTLAPSILVMTTCFTRFIIVFSFVRKALSLQTVPPNQVLIGLAMFLTFFVMAPVFTQIKTDAYDPFTKGQIQQEEAFTKAMEPLRVFMLKQVRTKDLALFVDMSQLKDVKSYTEVPTTALIPAFILSEIKTGFEIGFLLFLPFIVIDMVVSSVLMSLGMMMLPPVMISMPFKILLFIMVDGWNLLVEKLLITVR
jgi:flagellar biosynthetic protein FliP